MIINLAKRRRNISSAFEEFFFFCTQVAKAMFDPFTIY
jgi:hypothetical protein